MINESGLRFGPLVCVILCFKNLGFALRFTSNGALNAGEDLTICLLSLSSEVTTLPLLVVVSFVKVEIDFFQTVK